MSSQNGHAEVSQALLNARANIEASTGQQFTPLLVSSHNGHAEVSQAL